MKDLKHKTIRGASARLMAQGGTFSLRIISLMILARLLSPDDFGLVGMVTAFTGVLTLFRDFGLSAATVQQVHVTEEQTSTLFWLNVLLGFCLTAITFAFAPAIGAFYHEPRLVGVTLVVSVSFFVNGLGVQHSAMLQREMRFTALAMIEFISIVVSSAIGVVGAKAGLSYWALALMTVAAPTVSTVGLWIAAAWIPGKPRRGAGLRTMMKFGGTVTLNGLVAYVGANCEKVLLGRFWGAEAIGIYGRAYQLIRIPTDNLNWSMGEVAFSALSRIQHDADLLKRYFLKGYSLILALTLPITLCCWVFAEDVILVLLGPKWHEAVAIFRLLAPTILAFAILNPMGWLMNSIGYVGRGLKIALVLTPAMIVSYVIGLPYGPKGVATAYSAVMVLALVPLIAWSVKDTKITLWDVVSTAAKPVVSAAIAVLISYLGRPVYASLSAAWLRLGVEVLLMFVVYAGALLIVAGEKSVYRDMLRHLTTRSTAENATV